jgi:hypothetical protein
MMKDGGNTSMFFRKVFTHLHKESTNRVQYKKMLKRTEYANTTAN